MRKSVLSNAISEQRQSLLALVATMPDDAWSRRCPVPTPPKGVTRLEEPVRTVRDLVAHLCVVDGLALDANVARPWNALRRLEMPSGWDRRRLAPFLELSADELVLVLARGGERFGRMVAAAPPALGRLPVAGPFGRQPLTQLVTRRVLHEWLHERDIADATQAPPHGIPQPSPAVAEAMVDAVLAMLPEQVLPKTAADGGVVRLIIDLVADPDGHIGLGRRVWAADFTRRQYGPRVIATPDTTVRVDAGTLALLANGRADRLGANALLLVEGDQHLGETLLDAVRTPAPVTRRTDNSEDARTSAQTPSLY